MNRLPASRRARRRVVRPNAGWRALASVGLATACLNSPAVYFYDDNSLIVGGSQGSGGGPRAVGGEPVDGIGPAPLFGGGPPGAGGAPSVGGAPDAGSSMGGAVQLPASTRAGCPTTTGSGASASDFPPLGCPCHEGALYTAVVNASGMTDYYPVECLNEPLPFSLANRCWNVPTFSASCDDEGRGFSPDGLFVDRRSEGDIPVLHLNNADQPNLWKEHDQLGYTVVCPVGGTVIGTYDCGEVPTERGTGGTIAPGTYALTSLVQYGTPSFLISGDNFTQTLLLTPTSLALLSSDSHIFEFRGAYLYRTALEGLIHFDVLAATYEEAGFVPWTTTAAYTATDTQLDIYAPAEGFWATYVRAD